MRAVTPALKATLDGVRAAGGAMLMADCFTFTLASGSVLRVCDKDAPVTVGGNTFVANSIRVNGARYKSTVGLDVDSQEVDVVAGPGDMVGAVPALVALRLGLFDGAGFTRDRAFFAASPNGIAASFAAPAIGSINLFTGQVATIDSLDRLSAKITVTSSLAMLDVDLPKNYWQVGCGHALFDAGCGLRKSAYANPGAVGAGSSASTILWSGATATYTQGTLTMTSGQLSGLSAGIKAASSGVLQLTLPFALTPATGDTFNAYPGCDHTRGPQGCAKFANLVNYRGFPFIPPPSSTY